MPSALYPSFNGSPPSPEASKNRKKGVIPYSPLDDFAAQALSESIRGPKNIGKRKLRASGGPRLSENVSSNRSWPLLNIPGPSWGPPMSRDYPRGPPDVNPEPSRSNPGAIPKLSKGTLHQSQATITSQQPPVSSHQPAVTSLRSPNSNFPRSKKRGRRQAAEGP